MIPSRSLRPRLESLDARWTPTLVAPALVPVTTTLDVTLLPPPAVTSDPPLNPGFPPPPPPTPPPTGPAGPDLVPPGGIFLVTDTTGALLV